ncbi:MAG: hypothetical protein WC855_10450 [Thermodesulfovibrionales bacterium]
MKGPIGIKADILKTFIQEDRNEIRIIRDKIHNITSSIVVASFAITAFLFGKLDNKILEKAKEYSILVDSFLICLMLLSYLLLKRQLVHARKALIFRQKLLNNLADDDQIDINVFDNAELTDPDISDSDLNWFVGLAVSMLILKVIIGMQIFGS